MSSERLVRSRTQPILLLEWEGDSPDVHDMKILGTTNKQYDIHISPREIPSCTCPDFSRNRRGILIRCKHIYFALEQVLRLTDLSRPTYTSATLTVERIRPSHLSNRKLSSVPTSSVPVKRKDISPDEECQICLEIMIQDPVVKKVNPRPILWCQSTCGQNFHEDCFLRYYQALNENACPYCRAPILDLPPH